MAYITATLKSKDVAFPDGRVRILITFTGDSGEQPVDRDYIVDEQTTVANLRRWAYDEAQKLGGRKTIIDLLTVGSGISLVAPPAPPAATAKETWFSDLSRLARMQQAIAAGALPAAFDDAAVASLLSRAGSIPIVAGDF
jgi:hypothetical protein